MSAAEMQVCVRVDCKVEDVKAALWKDRSLVKTWLMRGTLHLVPSEDLPIFTAAMRTLPMRNLNAWLKFTQMTQPQLIDLFDAIGHALEGRTLTREELIETVARGRSDHIRNVMRSGWGGILKPVARNGLLCFGPSRGQSVTFVRPQQWLPSWRDVDPGEALAEIARRYLRAYGPATQHDFARWWGAWPGVGKAAWNSLAEDLVPVSIEGHRADMLAGDLRTMSRQASGPSVQLLPTFDPYLLGHANRDHLVEAGHHAKVSRVAGWISAVVLIEGRVAATWSHKRSNGTLHIAVEPFQRLPAKVRPEIRKRAEELAAGLGAARVTVTVA